MSDKTTAETVVETAEALKTAVPNELTNELANILRDVATSVGGAKDFMISELPDVVSQLLIWHGLYSAITTLSAIIFILVFTKALIKYSGQGELIDDTDSYNRPRYKTTLTHDSGGDIGPHIMASMCLLGAIPIAFTHINLVWLQIWVAPKVWLIEYASTLIK